MEPWKDFSARHGHCLAHYLELLAELNRSVASARYGKPAAQRALLRSGTGLVG